MLWPYARAAPSRPACAVDAWTGAGWRLLEHHALPVAAAPARALEALTDLRLRELPAVRTLFRLRGLPSAPDLPLRHFFSTPPFLVLAEEPGRELVFGVLRPGREGGPAPVDGAGAFRAALRTAPFAAIGNFRAEPRAGGALLWTETWVRTQGTGAGLAFGAYWLGVGPFSAWIRRMWVRAARARAEQGPPGA